MEYNEGSLIICKVKYIEKTAVFVETIDGSPGSIVLSEVAPGRIRNLRDYVVPNKIIVCKVLKSKDGHLFLSLRRVKDKEKKELIEAYKKEKAYESVIKKILGEKSEEVIKDIRKNQTITQFLEDSIKNPKILEKYFSKSNIKTIGKFLQSKKEKIKEIKKEIKLSCKSPNGIVIIKNLLKDFDGITYLGSSKFSIKRASNDLKKTDYQIREFLEELEKNAKKYKCEFEILKN
ncbi:MAG: hypothetical protein QW727_00485 [Candidatus Pacearchaeota archaeon]